MSRDRGASCRFRVRLTPRGGRDAIEGVGPDGALRVRVAAPPVDGAANRALVRLLAAHLGVPARDVRLDSGTGSRTKIVEVDGVSAEALIGRHPGLTL